MKISELTGYKTHPAYTASKDEIDVFDYTERLKTLGFNIKRLGSGAFAEVFERPGDPYVIKIFDNDPGYEQYVKYITQFKNNPHVPKLRGKIIKLQNDFRVVRMEKLRALDNTSDTDIFVYDLIKSILLDDGRYPNAYKKEVEQISDLFPKIMPLINVLQKYKKHIDFGKANLMFRGDVVPVLTDPLSYLDY